MADFEIETQENIRFVRAVLRDEAIRTEAGALSYMRGAVSMSAPIPGPAHPHARLTVRRSRRSPDVSRHRATFFSSPRWAATMPCRSTRTRGSSTAARTGLPRPACPWRSTARKS